MFHYEIDCNRKVLEMLESVPVEQRKDPLFQRAIAIADHVVVSRDNWLKWEFNEGKDMDPWYDPNASLEASDRRARKVACRHRRHAHHSTGSSVSALNATLEQNSFQAHRRGIRFPAPGR